ncbi:MAG: phosphatidate cytidylyltransferase [Anaerolineae bacterium]|nr:phosphatidate cytidylyltransferase [Anaerolineae bacterium]
MLRTRILVAVVLLPAVIAIILAGGWLLQLALLALLFLGARELIQFARSEGYAPSFLVAGAILVVNMAAVRWPDVLGPGMAGAIMLAMAATLIRFQRGDHSPLNSFALTLTTGLYLGWMGTRLALLRDLPEGEWWTLFVLFTTFAADTGAYAIGKPFGRHKLAPKISPKKSWEGYVGGVLTGALFGLAVGALAGDTLPGITPAHGLLIGLLIGVITPLGDLIVSAFKREAHVKDSSHLIPGHGGMLDRLDTVLLAVVLGYYYVLWFV